MAVLSQGICFSAEQDSLSVADQMKIHGILSTKWIMRHNGISNFTVCLNGLFMQNAAWCDPFDFLTVLQLHRRVR